MLPILKSTDPVAVETTIVALYGYPSAGKTTLAFGAKSPLLLDFDMGAHRSAFRGDSVPIRDWNDVAGMEKSDLAGYETIVVDTVGRCLDVMALDIMRENPKMRAPAGTLSLQGWGALKARFQAWMRELRSYGLDVVLVAHGSESRDGDDLILRPDVPGASYGEIFKVADGVGYLRIIDGKRVLSWDPHDRFVGKNPGMIPPAEIPNAEEVPSYLAGLLTVIKDRLGAMSKKSDEVRELVVEYRDKVKKARSAKALTELVDDVKENLDGAALHQAKKLIADRAKKIDVQWDGEKNAFAKKKAA